MVIPTACSSHHTMTHRLLLEQLSFCNNCLKFWVMWCNLSFLRRVNWALPFQCHKSICAVGWGSTWLKSCLALVYFFTLPFYFNWFTKQTTPSLSLLAVSDCSMFLSYSALLKKEALQIQELWWYRCSDNLCDNQGSVVVLSAKPHSFRHSLVWSVPEILPVESSREYGCHAWNHGALGQSLLPLLVQISSNTTFQMIHLGADIG